MGSSLSPVIANIVMEHIEQQAIATFSHDVLLWKRYVVDTFVILDQSNVELFHRHLNSIQ